MPAQPVIESTPTDQPNGQSNGQNDPGVLRAKTRLAEITRDLQCLAKRKLTRFELDARNNAALLQLRSEMANRNPASDSNDIVRLANCARRARDDYLNICGLIAERKPPKPRSMADVERELRGHG